MTRPPAAARSSTGRALLLASCAVLCLTLMTGWAVAQWWDTREQIPEPDYPELTVTPGRLSSLLGRLDQDGRPFFSRTLGIGPDGNEYKVYDPVMVMRTQRGQRVRVTADGGTPGTYEPQSPVDEASWTAIKTLWR